MKMTAVALTKTLYLRIGTLWRMCSRDRCLIHLWPWSAPVVRATLTDTCLSLIASAGATWLCPEGVRIGVERPLICHPDFLGQGRTESVCPYTVHIFGVHH